MYFDTINSTFDNFVDFEHIVDSSANFQPNKYVNWWVYSDNINAGQIISNTNTIIYLNRNIDAVGTYTMQFIIQDQVEEYSTQYKNQQFPEKSADFNSKLKFTIKHMNQRLKTIYPNALIYNLHELQTAFMDYFLYLYFFDNQVHQEDSIYRQLANDYKAQYEYNFELALKNIRIDSDEDGVLDEIESMTVPSKSYGVAF